MKPLFIISLLLVTSNPIFSQGTLIYDQQSATNGIARSGSSINASQPVGQSFMPTTSLVGFVMLQFEDFHNNNAVGSTVFVNLRENSIVGNILGSTTPVAMRDNFRGSTNFFFASNVPVLPGITYFFEPVLQTGEDTAALSDLYNYSGGAAYFAGQQSTSLDLWFREGYIVPEPSSVSCILTGGIGLVYLVRRKTKT